MVVPFSGEDYPIVIGIDFGMYGVIKRKNLNFKCHVQERLILAYLILL